jgi:hypothetical protein
MATEYDINYDDSRFKAVESEKQAALAEHEKTYDSMISNTDKAYQDQIKASNDWEKKQTELQNQQTDFAIQQIEQQKSDAQKDYTKEQSGAYVDWKTQSKEHGVRAEQIADKGMQNTGYSESMQVSMYNTYQNRVAVARESINRIFADYNNKITEARLQNNATLAEIAFKAQQQRLELVLQQLTAKNQLLSQKAGQKLEIENNYYNRYQDVLKQINTENALAEQIRQYNESLAEEKRQFDANFNRYSRGGGYSGGGGYSYSSGGSDGYTPTKEYKLPDDTNKSLQNLGLGGRSQEYIESKVNSGNLRVTISTKTGNPLFFSGTSAGAKNDTSAYWSNKAVGTTSSSSSSSSKSSNIVTKAWNVVKNLFK